MRVREAVIFDFDGTLADTLEAARVIFNEIAPEFGLELVEEGRIAELRHLNLRRLLKTLGVKKRHVPSILRKGRLKLREKLGELSPCEGLFEQLEGLRERTVRCGILTSNSVMNVEIFLRKHGVRQHFDFISTCSKLKGKAKYLKAIARTYSLEPGEMIYVGDEVRDVKACQKAGVPVVAVTWGFNSREALEGANADLVLSDPEGLLEALCGGMPGWGDAV